MHRLEQLGCQAKKTWPPSAISSAMWVSHRRALREPVVLHENVPEFDEFMLLASLGDLYIVLSVSPVCPSKMGWPIRRPRRISLLICKEWLYQLLEAAQIPRDLVRIQREVDISNLVMLLCKRDCHATWREFFTASDSGIADEVAWAARRPRSGASRLAPDAPITARAALTPNEEERLRIYQGSWPA